MSLQKMEEALPLGSSFLDLAIGAADWALRLLPQTRQADPLLYRLSGGGQSCPRLSQKGLGGAGGTRRMFCSPRHFLPTPGVQGGGGGELESKEQAGLEGLTSVTAIVCAVLKLPGCWLRMLTPSRVCMCTFRCRMHRQVRLRGQMLRIWLFF